MAARLQDRRPSVSAVGLPVMLILTRYGCASRSARAPGRSLPSLRYHGHELERAAPARQPPGSACGQGPRPYPVMTAGYRGGAFRPLPRRCEQRRSGRPESGRAPPCMRWRGPARPRLAGWPAAWPGRRRAPPAGARYPREGPVSRLLPRSRGRPQVPRWCPFPDGENISTASPGAAQEPATSHFRFLPRPQSDPQKAGSYPPLTAVIHGLIHSVSAGVGCEPEDTGTGGAECNRLSFSIAPSGAHLVTGSDEGTDGSRVSDQDPGPMPAAGPSLRPGASGGRSARPVGRPALPDRGSVRAAAGQRARRA